MRSSVSKSSSPSAWYLLSLFACRYQTTIETVLAALDTPLTNNSPIHIHIAEQQKEVKDCINWSGQRPVEWLNNELVWAIAGAWFTPHTLITKNCTPSPTSNAIAGLCPTTEANLGDGIFPAVEFEKANGRWAIGSDSHVSLSIVEELRTLEYGQRLRDQQRNRLHRPDQK